MLSLSSLFFILSWLRLSRCARQFAFAISACFMLTSTQAADLAQSTLPSSPDIKGSLLIIGGALRTDNEAVWSRMVEQAGGKGAKIAVIPAASANPEASGNATVQTLKRYGAQAFLVPLSVNFKNNNYRDLVKDPIWLAQLRAAKGVYFTGGDQGRITQVLLEADGQATPMLDAIWDIYRKGGVLAGTSAGAAIMSSTMFYDAKAVLPTLKFGVQDGKDIAPGLGFIGPDVFIDQHLIIRGRFARMLPVMLKKNYRLGLGVDENTAMLIHGQSEVEIIGYKGAILVDLSDAKIDSENPDFNVSKVKLSYLDRGDKFNLRTRVLTPPQDKIAGKLDSAKPYQDEQLFYPDILANTAVTDLMFALIDNKTTQALGLSFGSAQDLRPELGFEFRFSKTPESQGYFSSQSGAGSYSVQNIRLDIRPVKMQLPLYR